MPFMPPQNWGMDEMREEASTLIAQTECSGQNWLN